MEKIKIGIIGIGPRGLSILERIRAIYSVEQLDIHIELHLIDPKEYGQGSHYAEQPENLLVNTVASQITMFGDHTVTSSGPTNEGLSILEWARSTGYREINGKFYCVGKEIGNEIEENAYLPRRMLGEYLSWVFDQQINSLPQEISIIHHKHKAVNIQNTSDKLHVSLANGHMFTADYLFVTTGHGQNIPSTNDFLIKEFVHNNSGKNTQLNYYRTPYPLDKLSQISPSAHVVVQGIGLTAYDVLAQLTTGRGGKFILNNGGFRYQPSGREPKINLYSRQSLPFCSRGENEKGVEGQYSPKFLTIEEIDSLRHQAILNRSSHKLDFDKELLPLLKKEICYVYRCTLDRQWLDPKNYSPSKEDLYVIDNLFYPLKDLQFPKFDDFRQFVLEYLEADYQNAVEGNVSNPVKAATDVLRDVRDHLRYAIDYAGLTPESHKKFIQHYCPVMNRLAVGPPKERNMELMALIRSGIVDISSGPEPSIKLDSNSAKFKLHSPLIEEDVSQFFDVLIKAKIDSFHPGQDDSILMRNLLNNNLIQPFLNGNFLAGGIDINTEHQPINYTGGATKNLWMLGNIVEGANFYTYVLARPLVNSRFVRDADDCVSAMFNQIKNKRSYNATALLEVQG